MTTKQFFIKCLGDWESDRLYMYPKSGKTIKLTTCFKWEELNSDTFKVTWVSDTSSAPRELICTLKGDFYIERDAGYFTSSKTTSTIKTVSATSLNTITVYDGVMYDEHIEFVADNIRFRRTIAYQLDEEGNQTGEVNLLGTYVEKKVCLEDQEDYPLLEQ